MNYHVMTLFPDMIEKGLNTSIIGRAIENGQIYRYGSPLMRLEDLSYVNMGRTSSWGMTGIDVMWILIGVILGLTVIIGGVMFIWNKKKNQPAVKAKKK